MNNYELFVVTACSVISVFNPTSDRTIQVLAPDGEFYDINDDGHPVTIGKRNFEVEICTPGTYRVLQEVSCPDGGIIPTYQVNIVSTAGGGGGGPATDQLAVSLAIGDSGEVVRVDATTVPATLTLLDGTPYAGGVSLDVEYITDTTCVQTTDLIPVILTRVTIWDASDITTIQSVFINTNGAIVPTPAVAVVPCDTDDLSALQAALVTAQSQTTTALANNGAEQLARDTASQTTRQQILTELQTPETLPVTLRECVGNGNWRLRAWTTNSVQQTSVTPFLDVFPGTDEFGLPEILPNVDASISVSPDIDIQVPSTRFDSSMALAVNTSIQMIIEGYIITPEDLDFLVSYQDNFSYTGRIYLGTSPSDLVLQEEFVFGGPNANQPNGSYAPFRGASNACGQIYIRIYVADATQIGFAWTLGLGRDAVLTTPSTFFERISSVSPLCQTSIQWVQEGAQPVLNDYQQIGECNSEASGLASVLAKQTEELKTPRNLVTEIYQLYGDQAPRSESTASTGPGSTPNIGTDLTIAGPYQSLAWRFTRRSRTDPGDGTIGSVNVNGLDYFPGRDFNNGQNPYVQDGFSVSSVLPGEQLTTEFEFIANGLVGIEVIVTREA